MKNTLIATLLSLLIPFGLGAREKDGCTSITVGKLASLDGSVMTSHTADSREDRTWLDVVPSVKYKPGTMRKMFLNTSYTASAHDLSKQKLLGEIPQVAITYKYLNTMLPPINENQVAVGESTFGGKEIMRSNVGLIDYYELNRLMAERARSAREAIRIADSLTREYGYIDDGECFTIADPNEVWHLEIIGPGKGKKGAVWAAQRIPDDQVGVNANASRIRRLDLDKPNEFLASENVYLRAQELGLWNPKSGQPFEFCYVYADRTSLASRRREWRVFDLLAPSLKLDPNDQDYPFSVKPEKKVSPRDIMAIFRDTYEGTPFDMTKYLLVPEMKDGKRTGKFIKSPFANPFMDYDEMPLFHINGGWNELGERCIARYYCTYATVIQARGWLPNDIGGLVWFGYDNPAMTAYAPIYIGNEKMPESYKIDGRPGYNMKCAWWAFNRLADLSAQRWGDMRIDVEKTAKAFEDEAFARQKEIEEQALALYKKNPKKAREFLTKYTNGWLEKLVSAYWKLGDDLWTKWTGKF
jgi:dipeptidase